MKLAMIGLGRMGGSMVRRLMRSGHACVVFDRDPETVRELAGEGAIGAGTLVDVIAKLEAPRIIWLMLPAGEVTSATVNELATLLSPGDIVIDGGNSFWKDDLLRARTLRQNGVHYLDVGVSGGVWGLERGYCLMIGGPREIAEKLDPIFATLAPGEGDLERTAGREGQLSPAERGYAYVGPNGAGHFVKMVHNGIEYGMMQAYAEGFDILRNAASEAKPAEERLALDAAEIAEVWRRGSVVSSWLLDVAAAALSKDGDLGNYSGYVADSGEGRWTLAAAMEGETPANVLAAALFARFRSRQDDSFANKLLSAMREGFGGHKESKG
ncbi:MAG TPA: decarboxylating 6-phosphogluconate dehydrogenase [Candidatus Binatia bacterium]|nr:decarboxylating 6-phosphogluconate dehydrogenase [Candidatus Binatia bacterium]